MHAQRNSKVPSRFGSDFDNCITLKPLLANMHQSLLFNMRLQAQLPDGFKITQDELAKPRA